MKKPPLAILLGMKSKKEPMEDDEEESTMEHESEGMDGEDEESSLGLLLAKAIQKNDGQKVFDAFKKISEYCASCSDDE